MHRVRAAILSGSASAYRLIARKSGKIDQHGGGDSGGGPGLVPDIISRAGADGMSRIERASILHVMRDVESMPDDGSLAHWVTDVQEGDPLLAKGERPADVDDEEARSLVGEMIPRRESRTADSRREDRVAGPAEDAVIRFRDQDYAVRVVNTSSRGLQIESDLKAHIAEELTISLVGGAPTPCFVRWVRAGRIGLGFREEDLPH
jgi:hypothetical protein